VCSYQCGQLASGGSEVLPPGIAERHAQPQARAAHSRPLGVLHRLLQAVWQSRRITQERESCTLCCSNSVTEAGDLESLQLNSSTRTDLLDHPGQLLHNSRLEQVKQRLDFQWPTGPVLV
jgi:hypothetical protein